MALVLIHMLHNTVHRKYLVGEHFGKFGEFAKIFLINIHRHAEMHLAYKLIVAHSPNVSSPTAFTIMVHQNFPHQIFVYGSYS